MKLFRTASPTVVIECQRNFGFLSVALQIQIRTARFLQVSTATENGLCRLFYDNAVKQLCDMIREHNVCILRTSLRTQFMANLLISDAIYDFIG